MRSNLRLHPAITSPVAATVTAPPREDRTVGAVPAESTGWRTAHQAAAADAPVLREAGVLGQVLAGMNPNTEPAHADMVVVALVYLRCVDGDPGRRCQWGRYAYRAARQLWGDAHPTTLRISCAYQRLLTQLGHLTPAIVVCEQRLGVYQRLGLTETHLRTGLELALLLHDAGCCRAALRQVTGIWQAWTAGRRDPETGLQILAGRAVILAGCGRPGAATALFSRHLRLVETPTQQLREHFARTLATAETSHHAVCQHHPTPHPAATFDERIQAWSTTIQHAGTAHPADARHSPSPDPGTPSTRARDEPPA